MMSGFAFLFLLGPTALFASSSHPEHPKEVIDRVFPLHAFTALCGEGVGKLIITYGPDWELRVTAEAQLFPYLVVEPGPHEASQLVIGLLQGTTLT